MVQIIEMGRFRVPSNVDEALRVVLGPDVRSRQLSSPQRYPLVISNRSVALIITRVEPEKFQYTVMQLGGTEGDPQGQDGFESMNFMSPRILISRDNTGTFEKITFQGPEGKATLSRNGVNFQRVKE